MKRSHRRAHVVIWIVMMPILVSIIAGALFFRQQPAVNAALPPALSTGIAR